MSDMNTSIRLERFKDRLKQLEARRNALMRSGKYMQSIQLNSDIEDIRKMIAKEEEYYKPKSLKTLVTDKDKRKEVVHLIIESHLAADYLTATAYALKDWLDDNGLIPYSVVPELEDIIKKSEAFASSICRINPKLSEMMVSNDTLIDALHKKTMSYITRNLKDEKVQ